MKTTIKLLFVSAAMLVFSACKNETKTEGDATVVENSATANSTSERQGQAFIEGDESTPNILQIAIDSPDHTTLVAAVQAANLENALVNAGPLMVFAPTNAAFFAMGLSMLQVMVPLDKLEENSELKSVIFVAPVFRHTHFDGKQVVVHNRTNNIHELYSYNLYPGPSAKKGLYGVLLTQGEKENWVTAHCSAVQSISPYDNLTTFMHEGA
ncbi:MAG: DUF4914 family protein, partial [Draconibacterium sp.]|nr:DUF4914 family protein [Draconibacterium sp.]